MPFTKKMIQQLQKPSLKAFAFNGEPSPEEITLLDEYFWDFPNATKRVLRDGTGLYLVQRKATRTLDMSSLMSSLDSINDQVDIDNLNETLQRMGMGGGKKRKSRKSKKSRKSRKSRKSKKSRKSRKEMLGWQKW